ncbi:MAG: T9SS type A sorting domain-containing protein [Candidatus Zixiibacteriota bacterium]
MKKLGFLFLFTLVIFAQTDMKSSVIDNGGGKAESESNNLSASIGKSVIGRANSSEGSVEAGFIATIVRREAIEENPQKPDSKAISRIYPNPFNSSAYIDIDIDKQADIKIEIFDLFGKRIMEKTYRRKAGRWSIRFTAPEKMPGGLYLYRIIAGNEQIHDKMIYIK